MRAGTLAMVGVMLVMGAAQGQTVFTVNMNGAQVPTGSSFTGAGTVTLNQAQNQITVALTHDIPNANVINGHIHLGNVGVSGGVIFPFTGLGQSPISEVISVSPAQVAILQASGYYVNIHTIVFGGGEIRGQILPPVDVDQDLLDDSFETNTGTYVGPTNTGTNPNNSDTDGDGVIDGTEVQLSTDPNNALSFPSLPLSATWLLAAVASVAILGGGFVVLRRQRRA